MKDIIVDRLNKMEDLEQRKLLKNIVSGFLFNLIEYQETSNKNLETRVFEEIDDMERKYDVYLTVRHREDVDPIDQFLYPVVPEDMEYKKFDMKEITGRLNINEEVRLFSVFMKCGYSEIKRIADNSKEFGGHIVTDKGKYSISIKLEPGMKYQKEIEGLYDVFLQNGIPWKTINNPYANKFFDVILTGCNAEVSEEEEIKEIVINLEEYEKYRVTDAVLLWNIEKLSLKSDGFPMPALDRINYEHVISLGKTGPENGYLVKDDESFIKYIKRNKDELIIVSPMEKAGNWNIIKIAQPVDDKSRKLEYELVSNSRKNSFINKFAMKQAAIVRTKGEVMRIINSFRISDKFEFKGIEFGSVKNIMGITYDMNYFIVDDIRVSNDRKIMKLLFTAENRDFFLTCDLLSFLVSEIQMYFPEFLCEGILI